MQDIEFKQAKLLSIVLMELTKELLIRCKRRATSASRNNRTTALREVIGIIIMVSASMEAFINEFCLGKAGDLEAEGYEDHFLKNLIEKNVEIRLKWRIVPQLLWQSSFDITRSPWQDFDVLIKLRNDFLHYKGEYRDVGWIPNYLSHIRHLLSPVIQGGETSILQASSDWIDRLCNIQVAKWAFNTGIKMINQFLEFADEDSKSQYSWLMERLGIRVL